MRYGDFEFELQYSGVHFRDWQDSINTVASIARDNEYLDTKVWAPKPLLMSLYGEKENTLSVEDKILILADWQALKTYCKLRRFTISVSKSSWILFDRYSIRICKDYSEPKNRIGFHFSNYGVIQTA